jgi:hypothetical protein
MSASPVHYHKPTARCVSVLSPFLRHLNTGTLAFALFVALALLNPVRGKEPETRESAHARDTEPELAIEGGDTSLPPRREIQGHKFNPKDFGNKSAPYR